MSLCSILSTASVSNSVGEVMSVGLFFQLLVSAVSLAIYMFGIESNGNLSVSFFISIIGLTSVITTTYIFCFLSEYVTYKLSDIGDHFYNCAWYNLPVKQQKMFILPIQRAQVEFRINGLGLVECSLNVFSSVNSIVLWQWGTTVARCVFFFQFESIWA